MLPAGISIPPGEFHIVGRSDVEKTFALSRSVSAEYVRTLRIPILKGDTCSGDPGAQPFASVLVTRAFAERYFPDEDPIAHALTTPTLPPGTEAKIVGVVGDVRENGIASAPEPLIYWCGPNPYWPDPFFIVRLTAAHPANFKDVRAALRELEPQRAVYAVRPLVDLMSESTVQQRLNAVLLSLFGGTALLLAMLGLYGVLAQFVVVRRQEIGVRVAVGAAPADIVRLVLRHAAGVTIGGAAAGLAAAFAAARVMDALVFGVAPRDPVTFVAAPVLLGCAALAAAAIPARRAAHADPARVLHAD
jgi:hypothetical protein